MPMKTYVKCGVDELKKDDRIIYDDGVGEKFSTIIESVTVKTNSGMTTAKTNIPEFQEHDVTHRKPNDISEQLLYKLVKTDKGTSFFEKQHISDFGVGDKILMDLKRDMSPSLGTVVDVDTIIVPSRNIRTQNGGSIEIMSHIKRIIEVRADEGYYKRFHEQLFFREEEFD